MRFLPLSPPLLLIALCCASALAAERERIDDQWRFHLGDPVDAQLADFDDSLWDTVRLPHDWSINLPRSPNEPSAGGGGFFPTGIGWYRRTLDAVAAADERVWIAFDGVYRNSQVWLNGVQLGRHAYGYTPFEFEITEELAAEGPNTLAVRVDNSAQPNSRWYTGSGIYRHVWLERRPRRSIEPSSCVVTVANLAASSCELSTRAAVTNATATAFDGRLRVEILKATGQVVAATDAPVSLGAGDSKAVAQTLHLSNYAAWSPEDPTMYRARWRLEPTDARPDEKPIDAQEISFGVRTVSIDPERGLLLNGKPIVLYGGNVHHDNGCLGAAAFDDAARRKVRLLLEAGFNAVRTSHNPPSPAFLEACDCLGLLVIDEAFDCWSAAKVKHDFHKHFQEDWRRELTAMVLRDRNHPSVIMWSIGNEMYERGADHAPALAKELVETVRRLDATRPVTAGVNGLGPNDWNKLDRLFGALDAAGYNYEQARYDTDHNRVPDRVVYSSESYPKDLAFSRDAAMNRSYAIGDFVWSGIDYLGEAGIGQVFPPGAEVTPHWDGLHYPYHGASCGDIDLTGHRKPISHFRNIVWGRGEELSMAVVDPAPGGGRWQLDKWATDPYTASWTWPGREGQDQVIHVCSRWPSVRVELNGNAVAEVATGSAHEYVASFIAPYTPGELTAIALDNRGQEQSRFTLATAGPAARVRLAPDRTLLKSNNQGLCFVEVEVVDASGHIRPDAGHQVSYTLTGPGEIVGIGNGDLKSEEPYNISPRSVYHGRALVVLRSNGKPGKVTLTASAPELASGRLELTIQ